TGPALEDYLFETVSAVLGAHATNLTRAADLFAFGVDSLNASRIHNRIQQGLDLGGQHLSSTVVYEHPSVKKLAAYIEQVQSGEAVHKKTDQEKMLGYVEKWLAAVKPRSTTGEPAKPVDARVVVLTGATGSLGAHILAYLTASSSVRKVVCLSRAKSHQDSLERVRESAVLRQVQIDESKLVSYSSTVQAPFLGLTEEQYESLRSEVTDVIHNAWPVNFVMNVDSFDEHIGGSANLMNLALEAPWSEPATFLFSSSISCRMASPDKYAGEDFPPTTATAAGTGYAQGKWVVEKLSEAAAEKTGLPVAVLRIGQMSGDTSCGIWNETEAWPLLIRSANAIGALPVVDENPSWLPVDYAGEAIAEIVFNTSKPASAVYNIVNPNTETKWTDLIDWIEAAGVKFDKVDPATWVERLANSEQDPAKNPTVKLLGFFREFYGPAFRQPIIFKTEETLKWGPALGRTPPITKDIVAKWIGHWRKTGFMTN
ncbi:NAD(P)-binding protein, partial [Cylindrobasidium torrendii FP15055 ss-10]